MLTAEAKTIEAKTILSEQIVKQILASITKGELKPGDKLPPEKKLLEIYNVSRGSVREALRTLKIMNVIDIIQGKGAFVSALETGMLVEHLDFVFHFERAAISSLFEARLILEPEIAALAAERATDEEIAEMKELLQRKKVKIDNILHQKIAEAAKNLVTLKFITSIWSLGEASRRITSELPGVRDSAYAHHTLLVEAIEKHDPDLTRKIMREHLEFVAESYMQQSDTEKKK